MLSRRVRSRLGILGLLPNQRICRVRSEWRRPMCARMRRTITECRPIGRALSAYCEFLSRRRCNSFCATAAGNLPAIARPRQSGKPAGRTSLDWADIHELLDRKTPRRRARRNFENATTRGWFAARRWTSGACTFPPSTMWAASRAVAGWAVGPCVARVPASLRTDSALWQGHFF